MIRRRSIPSRRRPIVTLALDILLWLIAAAWWLTGLRAVVFARRLRSLPETPDVTSDEPRVAVVIAARDEADHIAATAQAFLAQTGVDLRLIIVNDRSTDGTGEALERVAVTDPRLTVVRIETLPAGWLGKCHALHSGAARVDADWLLFADADTAFLREDVIRRAVDGARADGVDHVCLFPRLVARSAPARAMACLFFLGVADKLDRINRDRPRSYFGVGAFNLIRAATYRSFGGHEPLKLEVLDDVHLGALVRRAGGRTRFLTAFDDVTTMWGRSVRDIIAVLEKNSFALIRYSLMTLALCVALFVVVWGVAAFGPLITALTGRWAPTAACAGLFVHGLGASIVARRFGYPPWIGFLAPFALPVLVYAGLRSAWLTLRRGGVQWRDTFYPIAELRAGRFR